MHDRGEKIVLGHRINTGGVRDGEEVIDILVQHPSTAKFIATKLVRRFVSDEPPDSLVDRVAAVYKKTDGDIREMLRTIFSSDEFYSVSAYRAKTKSPFELAVSSIRAVDGQTDGSPRLAQLVTRMGQPLYQYPASNGFPGPGFAMDEQRILGRTVELWRFLHCKSDSRHAVRYHTIFRRIAGARRPRLIAPSRSCSPEMFRTRQDTSFSNRFGLPRSRLARAFALVLGSPEFQRR